MKDLIFFFYCILVLPISTSSVYLIKVKALIGWSWDVIFILNSINIILCLFVIYLTIWGRIEDDNLKTQL